VTVQVAPSIVGPWMDLFRPPVGALSGHYVETDALSANLYYRLREEGGETTAKFTATALIPGWSYDAPVGTTHRIEYVSAATGWTNWQVLTNLTLPASPHLFLDTEAFDHPGSVYRTTPDQ